MDGVKIVDHRRAGEGERADESRPGPPRLLPDGKLALRSEPCGRECVGGGGIADKRRSRLELRPRHRTQRRTALPGYEAATREVSLTAGENRTLSVPLSGVFGEVTVAVQPADASAFVASPRAPPIQKLRAGLAPRTTSRFARPVSSPTRPASRRGPVCHRRSRPRCSRPSRPAWPPRPTNVRSKAELSLKLMPVGAFTMGSPRREPGRRANEAQRDDAVQAAVLHGSE